MSSFGRQALARFAEDLRPIEETLRSLASAYKCEYLLSGGLGQNIEEALGGYQPTAARFAHIDDAAEARLMALIARYRKTGWSIKEPCSGFAHDAWLAATGENLHQSCSGQSNPTSLNAGIVKVNHGKRFWIKTR